MGNHTKKAEVRHRIRQQLRALVPRERERLSREIVARLKAHSVFMSAERILAFASLPDEVCLYGLLRGNPEEGRGQRTFYLPRVVGDELEICPYEGVEGLSDGAFHIKEPQGAALPSLEEIDLILVPGLAFTPGGHRLGRGRGYYDRLLSRPDLANAYKIGICFPFQLVRHLPVEPHDIMMDAVITLPND